MNLSPTIVKCAAIYEQDHGHNPSELAIRVVNHIDQEGNRLRKQGQDDARKGMKAYPADYFQALAVKAFRMDVDEDHETVQAVADLWQSDYMDGYNTGEGSA